jgi:uncharacterized RDD family membrane protein YckC
MKRVKLLFGLRLSSTLIDLSIIYCLSILSQALIYTFAFLSFSLIFTISFLLYYFISYWLLKGSTPAKLLTGLKIVNHSGEPVTVKNILLREIVLKGIVGIIIPAFFIQKFFTVWSGTYTAAVFILMLLLSLVLLFIFKRTWWEQLSQTQIVRAALPPKATLKYLFLSITLVTITSILLIIYPFVWGKENIHSSFMPHYPVTKETKRYASYIKDHSKEPVDYVFDLFQKYDIVVISERLHPEYTQYELFSDIIRDPRFINTVGNIFTECGSVSFQDTLTTYLHTRFANEDELNKGTSILQRNSNGIWPLWDNTNLFDFFKTVNKVNNTLADSAKINWYFTDLAVDWETMTHEKYIEGYTNPIREKVMADNISDKYNSVIVKQKRKKALVIMNTMHGYGLIDSRFSEGMRFRYKGTTAYLMERYPGKIANVMMNFCSLKYALLFSPVQNGKWETAFSILGNPDAGFDFSGSPFGDDNFDAAFLQTPSLKYKDVFTGFIYYKPFSEQTKKNLFPYEFDHFEDSILRRATVVSKDYINGIKKAIAAYKKNPTDPVVSEPASYAVFYNLIWVILVPFLIILSYVLYIVFFIKKVREN